ncbi:hypothetical protein ARAF_2335 [Arsenophonus endosymbiont of Aleurodicus floccissimus]|uniref:hypothetical protein n=1 Tax=Arsenophonus endosymbiont of Aleurodicus floccissimus TaxID=2152761 RepID=UPI000EBAC704|nr:hypothetical protein [Arsenophonus endosymbiont of Aleurodicus floccissimus]SPP32294.1 hypothetical protein ARAF_2335 [Arsenophonus endosymbiont of Aleurodicus floccissimus]
MCQSIPPPPAWMMQPAPDFDYTAQLNYLTLRRRIEIAEQQINGLQDYNSAGGALSSTGKAGMNHSIDCRVGMPDIDDKVLIYRKENKMQLIGTYLGNSKFHYGYSCQGIQKTCTASHSMPLPEPPNEDNALETFKNAREALLNTPKKRVSIMKERGKYNENFAKNVCVWDSSLLQRC